MGDAFILRGSTYGRPPNMCEKGQTCWGGTKYKSDLDMRSFRADQVAREVFVDNSLGSKAAVPGLR